ncbi:hypothetical protein PIIN_07879 [Serendipita indica DSM 11827]|uniref:Uncharacterized protein n=1 Tax=Serendipita indica (strain DSM 11827) TaxID=1109443 RepID=G4TRI3_SERID|nr:hypothetical protein PIIN_07879 [Serendipita indica DSM 11827]
MGVTAHAYVQDDAGQMTIDRFWDFIEMNRRLRLTLLSFTSLLAIDIIVSVIALKVVQRRMNFVDPSLVLAVYTDGRLITLEEFYRLDLAAVILNGLCKDSHTSSSISLPGRSHSLCPPQDSTLSSHNINLPNDLHWLISPYIIDNKL